MKYIPELKIIKEMDLTNDLKSIFSEIVNNEIQCFVKNKSKMKFFEISSNPTIDLYCKYNNNSICIDN
jgi:hypothetical protein